MMKWGTLFPKNWREKNIVLWLSLFLLNVLCFSGHYFHTLDSSLLLPINSFSKVEGFKGHWAWLFDRSSLDIWRVSIDFLILIVLTSLLIKRWPQADSFLLWVVPFFYSILFFYQLYESSIFQLYHRNADLLHDYFLVTNGFKIMINEWWMLSLFILGFLVYVLVISTLFRTIIRHPSFPRFYKNRGMWFIAVMTLTAIPLFGFKTKEASFPLILSKMKVNLENSYKHRFYREIEFTNIRDANRRYSNFLLDHKPNVFVVFIESYGKTVFGKDSVNSNYTTTIQRTDSLLKSNGYHVQSNLSHAPVFGGASWISFSSALYGYKMQYHSLFDYMVNNTEIDSCLNLYRWLQHQGYAGYFLSPFEPKNYYVPYEKYKKFYALPNWIDYTHFTDYEGQRFGWNLPPSDQYVINYSYDLIKKEASGPRMLFYMTKNSHYPWHSPLQSVENWKTLKEKPEDKLPYAKPTMFNYINAISFQIDYLSRFMIDEGNSTDVFVLIGDHQPPKISQNDEGFETPIHVISKDSLFVASFQKYGFSPSLKVDHADSPMRHEALLSLMTRELIRRYGKDTTNLPEYLPNGIIW